MGVWSEFFVKACPPLTKYTGSEWADKYGYIPPPAPEVGPWRTKRTPYLREILDVVSDNHTEEVVWIASSQVGKTAGMLQSCGFFMHQSPSSIMILQPTLEMAEAFSKERLDPTIKYTKVLRDIVELTDDSGAKTKRSTSTTRMKYFTGGYVALVGSNSPAGLASRPIRVLLADEIDRYPASAGKEGDPLKLAKQRTTNFHNRKILYVSTPTIKGESKIDDLFEKSDKRYFEIPCQHCGEYQALVWSQVKFKNDDGESDPKSARYECAHCGEIMRGSGKPLMNMIEQGKWVATAESKIAGFHISSLYSPWVSLEQLVEEWLEVAHKRDRKGIMEFLNLKLGLCYEEAEQTDDHEHIYAKRREFYNCEVPEDVLLLTAGVDVQDDRLEAELVGWSHDYESWGIEYRTFIGDPGQSHVWNELDAWLLKDRVRGDDVPIRVMGACVDSGGHNTTEVYTFCKAREQRNVFAIKGKGGLEVPFVPLRPSKVGRMGAALFNIGVDDGKSSIYSNLKIETAGPNYCHFPRDSNRGYEKEYFQGLYSERKIYKYVNGARKAEWKKVYDRNEPLDCRNYAHAAARILRPDFESLQRYLDQSKGVSRSEPVVRRKKVLSRGIDI